MGNRSPECGQRVCRDRHPGHETARRRATREARPRSHYGAGSSWAWAPSVAHGIRPGLHVRPDRRPRATRRAATALRITWPATCPTIVEHPGGYRRRTRPSGPSGCPTPCQPQGGIAQAHTEPRQSLLAPSGHGPSGLDDDPGRSDEPGSLTSVHPTTASDLVSAPGGRASPGRFQDAPVLGDAAESAVGSKGSSAAPGGGVTG